MVVDCRTKFQQRWTAECEAAPAGILRAQLVVPLLFSAQAALVQLEALELALKEQDRKMRAMCPSGLTVPQPVGAAAHGLGTAADRLGALGCASDRRPLWTEPLFIAASARREERPVGLAASPKTDGSEAGGAVAPARAENAPREKPAAPPALPSSAMGPPAAVRGAAALKRKGKKRKVGL